MDSWAEMEEQILKELNLHRMKDDAEVFSRLERYSGSEAGEAAVDLLYGTVNPSGKLAETFPRKLSDTPAYLSFPGERETSVYSEGVFVGYRYYDTKEADVLFPFGLMDCPTRPLHTVISN